MKIIDIRATPVSVPLEAPLRHANGCHWGRFVRTIVEVETDDGLIGLGEMGGGGESAVAAFAALKPYVLGTDPAQLEEMRFMISNPTASLYNNRTQMLAALEFACLDILGQNVGRACLARSSAAGCATTCPSRRTCSFATPTRPTAAAKCARAISWSRRRRRSRRSTASRRTSSRAASSRPEYELECYRALAAALPGDRFRFDPNGVWSTEQAIWFGQHIEDLNNDYLEDPVFGLHGMRRTREKVRMPLATNTVVVNFEQLAANVLQTAVDVILLDTTFWGGIRQCVKAAGRVRQRSSSASRCIRRASSGFSSRRCSTSAR